jgi:hypothetical protein
MIAAAAVVGAVAVDWRQGQNYRESESMDYREVTAH